MTPLAFFVAGGVLILLAWAVHHATTIIPPDLELPPCWRPHPRTVVHTHHLTGGRSW